MFFAVGLLLLLSGDLRRKLELEHEVIRLFSNPNDVGLTQLRGGNGLQSN